MIDLEALKAGLAEYDPNSPKCQLQIARHRTDHDPFSGYVDMVTYSPCCRPEGHEGMCRNSRSVMGWPDFSTVSALLTEIESLRNHRELCTDNLRKGYETGKADERAAVVAWLRRGDACCAANATRIESGAHRREEKP